MKITFKKLIVENRFNEFNHFEYDMCLFLPALDISNQKLNEEKVRIKEICDIIKLRTI